MKFLKLLICLTIICLPLYIIRFQIPLFTNFSIPTTLLEILILVSVGLTLIKFIIDGLPFSKLKTKYDKLIVLFLVAGIISTIISPDLRGALGILKAYFIEPVLFYYSIVYLFPGKSKILIYSLIASAFWLSLLGFLQKLTGGFSLAPAEIAQGRISGVYNSANALSLFIGPILFLTLSQFFIEKKPIKYLFLSLVFLFTLEILWTKSRGGLGGEIAGAIVFLFLLISQRIKKWRKFWWILPITFVVLITIFFYQIFTTYNPANDYLLDSSTSGDTLQIRYELWLGTLNLVKNNPILGAGLNGFKVEYSNHYKLSIFQENLQYPHNILLNFWTETGLLGLISFLLIVLKSFQILWKNIFLDARLWFSAGLICSLTYILVHGMVDVPYFKNDLSVEFWIILGLIEIFSRKNQEAE